MSDQHTNFNQAPPKYVDHAGTELIIRVVPGTTVPCAVVGVEVTASSWRLVMEVQQDWVDSLRAAMKSREEWA